MRREIFSFKIFENHLIFEKLQSRLLKFSVKWTTDIIMALGLRTKRFCYVTWNKRQPQ